MWVASGRIPDHVRGKEFVESALARRANVNLSPDGGGWTVVTISCPGCGETYHASAGHVGGAIRCVTSGCGRIIRIESQRPPPGAPSDVSPPVTQEHVDPHDGYRPRLGLLYGVGISVVALVALGVMLHLLGPSAPLWTPTRVGTWYRLAPALENVDAPGALTGQWQHSGAFDSAQACEGARARWAADALKDTVAVGKRLKEHLTEAELARTASEMERATAYHLRARQSQCVSADDPRLRTTEPIAALAVIAFPPGHAIHVEARINESIATRLQLDTGADRTMMAPRVLRAAGLAPRRTAIVRGVTGQATIDVYEISSLEVGGARVGRLKVFAYDIGETGSDGLLGQDFLAQFTVTIDHTAGRVTLSPK